MLKTFKKINTYKKSEKQKINYWNKMKRKQII